MPRSVKRAFWIVLTGAALGIAGNAVSPRKIPYITPPKTQPLPGELISLAEAETALYAGAMFLDARSPADYRAGHIAGALNLPAGDFQRSFPKIAGSLAPETLVVVYCDGEICELSHDVAGKLRQSGYSNVRVLLNGWTVWRRAGLPTHTGDEP
jgi:rhodanese-related sulfurtransferase